MEKTHTWDLVDLPHGKSVIGCKWVYKIKTKFDGTIERYKTLLVAKGYAQEYRIDYVNGKFCVIGGLFLVSAPSRVKQNSISLGP